MKAWLKSILIRHPTVQRLQHRLRQHRTISELREVAEIFRNNRCVWSLQSGNTLGIYRDGGFLPNENDVDIAVLAEDWHRGIEEELRHHGYAVVHECGGYKVGAEGVYITVRKQGFGMEIYPAFKDSWDGIAYRWYGGTCADRYHFDPELLEETRPVDFHGAMVQIPADTDRYLTAIYGADYMIPNPKWDWRTQPKCRLALSPTYLVQADIDTYTEHAINENSR